MNVIIAYDFAHVPGGAGRVAIDEAIALHRAGVPVTFFAGAGPVEPQLRRANVPLVCLEQRELKEQLGSLSLAARGALQGLWNRRAAEAFDRLLASFDPADTIVHFHGWSNVLSPALFRVTGRRGFKIAFTCHDYELSCPVRVYYNFRKGELCAKRGMSPACICTNCDKRSMAQKMYRVARQLLTAQLLRKNRVSLIYLNAVSRERMHGDLKFTCDEYILRNLVHLLPPVPTEPQRNRSYLYIGRVEDEKGALLFCEAVTRAKVAAGIIGEGGMLEQVRERYPEIPSYGWLSSDEMDEYLRKARCFIVSSKWMETGPLTVPEVQCSYALPCIVPEECGVAEDVLADRTGLTYRNGDLEDLVACIERSKDDELIAILSRNCRAIDRKKYEEAAHLGRLMEIYEQILRKK